MVLMLPKLWAGTEQGEIQLRHLQNCSLRIDAGYHRRVRFSGERAAKTR